MNDSFKKFYKHFIYICFKKESFGWILFCLANGNCSTIKKKKKKDAQIVQNITACLFLQKPLHCICNTEKRKKKHIKNAEVINKSLATW